MPKPIPVATELLHPIVVPSPPAERLNKPSEPKLGLLKPYKRVQVILEYDSALPGLDLPPGVEKTERILKCLAKGILADTLLDQNTTVSYNLMDIPT